MEIKSVKKRNFVAESEFPEFRFVFPEDLKGLSEDNINIIIMQEVVKLSVGPFLFFLASSLKDKIANSKLLTLNC